MAIWKPELVGRSGPKYLQIVEALAEDIASGALPAGARLPPHRELAYALNVSPNTTSRAYREAVTRALIQGEVGRGTFVRAADGARLAGHPADMLRTTTGPIDLSSNLPCSGLAAAALADTLTALGRGRRLEAFTDYQTETDIAHHVDAAIAWLNRSGITADGEQVAITNGAQHGILCSLMAVTRPGDLLLTEALTYAPIKAMAERLALKLAPVPIDDEGLCPDALDGICRSSAVRAVYMTPTLQTPTTATMGADRRARIAEIVDRHGFVLIEDDVFGLLKPDSPQPIARLVPERTVYITSTSKCLAPGLRVGFARAAAPLAMAIRNAVGLTCLMPAPLMVEIAARWIADGMAERLTEMQRAHAAERQAAAAAVFADHDVRADANGLHLWLILPPDWSADTFRAEAAAGGVQFADSAVFSVDPGARLNAVRLCLSHEPDNNRLMRGLETLQTILRRTPAVSSLVI